jgi:hypothetical protein
MTDAAEDFDEDLGAAIEDLMAGVVKLDKTPADKKLAVCFHMKPRFLIAMQY